MPPYGRPNDNLVPHKNPLRIRVRNRVLIPPAAPPPKWDPLPIEYWPARGQPRLPNYVDPTNPLQLF